MRGGGPGPRTGAGSREGPAGPRSGAAEVVATVLRERFGLRGQIGQDMAHELGLGGKLERRVEAPFEADRGAGLAAQPLATGGASEVGREDLDVVRKLEQLAMDALVELFRERRFCALSEQVRPSHAAREERVAG